MSFKRSMIKSHDLCCHIFEVTSSTLPSCSSIIFPFHYQSQVSVQRCINRVPSHMASIHLCIKCVPSHVASVHQVPSICHITWLMYNVVSSMPSHMASVASIGEKDFSWLTNKSNSIPSISHHRGKGHITPIMHNVVGGATTSGMPVTGLFPDYKYQVSPHQNSKNIEPHNRA